jgi:hypothetical protein
MMEGRRDQLILAPLAEGLTNQPGSSIHRPAALPCIDELLPGHPQLVGTEARIRRFKWFCKVDDRFGDELVTGLERWKP